MSDRDFKVPSTDPVWWCATDRTSVQEYYKTRNVDSLHMACVFCQSWFEAKEPAERSLVQQRQGRPLDTAPIWHEWNAEKKEWTQLP